MELLFKIFEVLGITGVAVIQMALVVVLAAVLSATLIRPILSTFDERENRSTRPLEESRRLLGDAETKAREYDESLRRSAAEVLARKRARIEEASRAERRRVETAAEAGNRDVESMRAAISREKEAAAAILRSEVDRLSGEIAGKVLGRSVS